MDFKNKLTRSSVIVLVGVWLFWASAQAQSGMSPQAQGERDPSIFTAQESVTPPKLTHRSFRSKDLQSSIRKSFELGADWKKRLGSLKSGGGGGVDGGGGNITKDESFDSFQNSGLEKLSVESLRETAEQFYAERLRTLENDLPGFKNWLYAGFTISWFADEKPFAQDFCLNQSIYAASHEVVACQTWTSVKIQKSWLTDEVPDQSSYLTSLAYELVSDKRASLSFRTGAAESAVLETPTSGAIVVHELLRYHVIRLARELHLSRLDQDDLVAQATSLILNPKATSEDVYATLVRTGVLPSPKQVAELKHQSLNNIQQSMFQDLNRMQQIIDECVHNRIEPNGFDYLMRQYIQSGVLCSQEAQREEVSLCLTERNQRLLVRQHQKYCIKK